MSIAVAVTKNGVTVVAADSQENFGDRRVPLANQRAAKVMAVGDAFLAATGWGLYANILEDYLRRAGSPRLKNAHDVFSFFMRFWKELGRRYTLVNQQPHEDDPSPFAELDASFLIGSSGGIFYVSTHMSVTRFDHYYAVGSGSSYALGALHALYEGELDAASLARRACEAAMAFDLYCGGTIDSYSVATRKSRAAQVPSPPATGKVRGRTAKT